MLYTIFIHSALLCIAYWLLLSNLHKITTVFRGLEQNSLKSGKNLYDNILQFNKFCLKNGKKACPEEYKFFTTLYGNLLEYRRRLGVNIDHSLKALRKGLLNDLKMERRLKEVIKGSAFELVMVSFITWAFFLGAKNFLSFEIDTFLLSTVACLQLLGLSANIFAFYYLKRLNFKNLQLFLESLYTLNILFSSQRPIKEVVGESKLSQLDIHGPYQYLAQRAQVIVEKIQKYGSFSQEESDELIEECWISYDQSFETFLQRIKVVKLLVLLCFFGSAYLLMFYNIFLGLIAQ